MRKSILVLFVLLVLTACGNSYSPGSGGEDLSHSSLGGLFVSLLNTSGQYEVEMAKRRTLQYDFIVIYDHNLNEYLAIDIGDFEKGMNAVSYLNNPENTVYRDLEFTPGHFAYDPFLHNERWFPDTFYHPEEDLLFEKSQISSKDLEKFAALAEEKVVSIRADSLARRFGLSVDRSKEVVRLSMVWQRRGGKDLSDFEIDLFSTEILGFSITEAKLANAKYLEGDSSALEGLIRKAAIANESSPDNMRSNISQFVQVDYLN